MILFFSDVHPYLFVFVLSTFMFNRTLWIFSVISNVFFDDVVENLSRTYT